MRLRISRFYFLFWAFTATVFCGLQVEAASFPSATSRLERLIRHSHRDALAFVRSHRASLSPPAPWLSMRADVIEYRGTPADRVAPGAAPFREVWAELAPLLPRARVAECPGAPLLAAGLAAPLQGFLFGGVFYADCARHECLPGPALPLNCSVGGAWFTFPSEGAAAATAAAAARAAHAALRRHLGLAPPPGAEEVAAATVRRVQLSYNGTAKPMVQTVTAGRNVNGRRRVLLFSTKWKGEPDASATDPKGLAIVGQRIEDVWNARAFSGNGGMLAEVTVLTCVYELVNVSKSSFALWSDANNVARDAARAALLTPNLGAVNATSGCSDPTINATQYAAYQNVQAWYQPGFGFSWAGLASVPGAWSWIAVSTLVPNPNPGSVAYLASVAMHEIGHNFGLSHAGTWKDGNATVREEYGDRTDIMGGGSSDANGFSDYNAGQKHALGWLPNARVVNLHPAGAGPAQGFSAGATFLLAAHDRNGGDAAWPASVALAARHPVPPRWYLDGQELRAGAEALGVSGGGLAFAYLSVRATLALPSVASPAEGGVYVHEMRPAPGGAAGWTFGYCYRDPFCSRSAAPIPAFDALLVDRNGTRALVEVGGASRLLSSGGDMLNDTAAGARADSVFAVRVSFLGADGARRGAPPRGCDASGCAPPPGAVPPFTRVAAPGVFSLPALNASSPVALFRLVMPGACNVSVTTCGAPTPGDAVAPLAVSAFFGGFPTAHALYTGSVGVSGHVNSHPVAWGDARFAPVLFAGHPAAEAAGWGSCGTVRFQVAGGQVVWVVAGAPGATRGAAVPAGAAVLTVATGGQDFVYPRSFFPFVVAPSLYSGSAPLAAMPDLLNDGQPVYTNGNWYLRRTQCSKSGGLANWVLGKAAADNTTKCGANFGNVGPGNFSAVWKMGVCPEGTLAAGAACSPCAPSLVTPHPALGAAPFCTCPPGTKAAPSTGLCDGPSVGGPDAAAAPNWFTTPVAAGGVRAAPPDPFFAAATAGGCGVGSGAAAGGACAGCGPWASAPPGGGACACPPGYGPSSSGGVPCAPPMALTLPLPPPGAPVALTLAGLQYVPLPAGWVASPVYRGAVGATPAVLYWAWGGPWGRPGNDTALAITGAPHGVRAGANWALDFGGGGGPCLASAAVDNASALHRAAAGGLPATSCDASPSTPLPPTFGFAPHAAPAPPLPPASPVWMLFGGAPYLNDFVPAPGVALAGGGGGGACAFVAAAPPAGAPPPFKITVAGLLGPGDRVAAVVGGASCLGVVDPGSGPYSSPGLVIVTVGADMTAALPLKEGADSGWALCGALNPAVRPVGTPAFSPLYASAACAAGGSATTNTTGFLPRGGGGGINEGVLVGAALGGVGAALALGAAAWALARRRRRRSPAVAPARALHSAFVLKENPRVALATAAVPGTAAGSAFASLGTTALSRQLSTRWSLVDSNGKRLTSTRAILSHVKAAALPLGWRAEGPDVDGDVWYEHQDGTQQWQLPAR
jgi:hypothetical protein